MFKEYLLVFSLLITSVGNANNLFDLTFQSLLEWKDPEPAQHLSDILQTSLIISPFVASALQKEDRLTKLGIVGGVTATNMIMTTIIKYSVGRERPNHENNLSFPSGHTSSAFTGAALTCFFVDKTTCGILTGFSAITGYLRVAGGKHWMTDVIFGAGLGYANGYFIPTIGFNW